jgi:hypothetical protein
VVDAQGKGVDAEIELMNLLTNLSQAELVKADDTKA